MQRQVDHKFYPYIYHGLEGDILETQNKESRYQQTVRKGLMFEPVIADTVPEVHKHFGRTNILNLA